MNSSIKGKGKHDYLNIGKYAVGGVGFSITNQIVLAYLTFFCTDIFGVSSMTVAGLMLITKIIDAITDPIMGFIADQTRIKKRTVPAISHVWRTGPGRADFFTVQRTRSVV